LLPDQTFDIVEGGIGVIGILGNGINQSFLLLPGQAFGVVESEIGIIGILGNYNPSENHCLLRARCWQCFLHKVCAPRENCKKHLLNKAYFQACSFLPPLLSEIRI
jgi:hypothetical protein